MSTCSDRPASLVIQKSSKKVSARNCPSVHLDHYPLIRHHPPASATSALLHLKEPDKRRCPPCPAPCLSNFPDQTQVQSREGNVERNTGCGSDVCSVSPATTVRGLPTVEAIRLRPAILIVVIISSVLIATITDLALVGWCHPGMEPY